MIQFIRDHSNAIQMSTKENPVDDTSRRLKGVKSRLSRINNLELWMLACLWAVLHQTGLGIFHLPH